MGRHLRRPLILAACLIFLTWGMITSGLRLWANVIMLTKQDAARAAHIAPFDRTFLFLAGNSYMRKKDCGTAIKTFESLITFYPYYWDAWNNVAICLAVVGESEKAKRHWEEIIQRWPSHEVAKKNLQEIQKKSKPGK